jgi:hypothetical protein
MELYHTFEEELIPTLLKHFHETEREETTEDGKISHAHGLIESI